MNPGIRFRALFSLYLVAGLAMASWVTRTPAIRDAIAATTLQMGWLFFGLSAGSMAGVLAGTPLVRRLGTKAVITLTLCLWIGGTFGIAAGAWLVTPMLVGIGLSSFGAGLGCAEIAFNIDGAEVERQLGRPMLPYLHGAFSIGTVLGGLVGIWLSSIGFAPALQLALAGTIALAVALAAIGAIPAGYAQGSQTDPEHGSRGHLPREGRVLRIALIVLVLALAEGTANDWLPLVIVDGHQLGEATGSAVYTVFAAAMATGRFSGPAVLTRLPRVAVVALSGGFAALGLLGVMLAQGVGFAYASVVLWGLGAALGFPVSISAAAEGDPATAPGRVGTVATTGYIGFLVGPPLLGLLADQFGLRQSLLAVLILVGVAILLAPAVRPVASGDPSTVARPERGPA